jgi:hypothetical protein
MSRRQATIGGWLGFFRHKACYLIVHSAACLISCRNNYNENLFVLGLTEILEALRYDGDVFGMLPALLRTAGDGTTISTCGGLA